jgi:hypothetical protein
MSVNSVSNFAGATCFGVVRIAVIVVLLGLGTRAGAAARSPTRPSTCSRARTGPATCGSCRTRSIVSAGSKLLLDASDLIILTDEERAQLAELEAEARGAKASAGFVPKTLDELDLAKRTIVEAALRASHGSAAEAAGKLGVPARTLQTWCKRWKVTGG